MSVRIYGSSDWICGLVHCSGATSTIRSRKLAPTAFSLCFPGLCTPPCHGIWLIDRDIYCPDRVDNCFLGLHYTFGERKLSTGFWIIAIKFVLRKLLFTHHYPARCFGMNMPKSRDIQAKIPLPQAIWNEFWLCY